MFLSQMSKAKPGETLRWTRHHTGVGIPAQSDSTTSRQQSKIIPQDMEQQMDGPLKVPEGRKIQGENESFVKR